MLIGYARVSTDDQNLNLQKDALTRAGCERILEDRQSGAKADRPGLRDALDYARDGDTLTVWRLDRLSRSLKDLIDLVSQLEARVCREIMRILDCTRSDEQQGIRRRAVSIQTRSSRTACSRRSVDRVAVCTRT